MKHILFTEEKQVGFHLINVLEQLISIANIPYPMIVQNTVESTYNDHWFD